MLSNLFLLLAESKTGRTTAGSKAAIRLHSNVDLSSAHNCGSKGCESKFPSAKTMLHQISDEAKGNAHKEQQDTFVIALEDAVTGVQ